jgi:hypothetical protein
MNTSRQIRFLHSGGGAHLVFTSLVFLLYDRLVERRQKVMSTAVQSSAIVSSLFPSQVRDRLFPIDGEGHEVSTDIK